MKVGSLVICPKGHTSFTNGCTLPPSDTIIYTVSEITDIEGEYGIQLQEIPIVVNISGGYDWYYMDRFVEIQPYT